MNPVFIKKALGATLNLSKFSVGKGIAIGLVAAGLTAGINTVLQMNHRVFQNAMPLAKATMNLTPTFGQGFQIWANKSTYSRLQKSTIGLTQSLYALRHKGMF